VLRRQRHALGAHELDVGDAQEAEHRTQVGLLEIGRRAGVQATAAAGDDHLLAAGQALRTGLGVAEGAAGHGDAVDPGLQRGGDREVVHGRADHHDVGLQELLQHPLGLGGMLRIGLGQVAGGQVGQGLAVQVAVLDHQVVQFRRPVCDDGGTQLARDGVLAQGAGIDVQEFHGSGLVGGGESYGGALSVVAQLG